MPDKDGIRDINNRKEVIDVRTMYVPEEVIEAQLTLSRWMEKRGYKAWEFGDTCSRNYADKVREIATLCRRFIGRTNGR